MELTERKKKILRAIVDEYIRTAEAGGLENHRADARHGLLLRDHPQ